MPLLARETGLEPATSGVTGRRSNQLSYSRSKEGPFRPGGRWRQGGFSGSWQIELTIVHSNGLTAVLG